MEPYLHACSAARVRAALTIAIVHAASGAASSTVIRQIELSAHGLLRSERGRALAEGEVLTGDAVASYQGVEQGSTTSKASGAPLAASMTAEMQERMGQVFNVAFSASQEADRKPLLPQNRSPLFWPKGEASLLALSKGQDACGGNLPCQSCAQNSGAICSIKAADQKDQWECIDICGAAETLSAMRKALSQSGALCYPYSSTSDSTLITYAKASATGGGYGCSSIKGSGTSPPQPTENITTTTTNAHLSNNGICEWKEKDVDSFVKKILVTSSCANVLGFVLQVIISGPLCCGCGRDYLTEGWSCRLYALGLTVIVGGIITALIPLFGVKGACMSVDDDICDNCADSGNPCDAAMRTAIQDTCEAVGILAVYLYGYGWAAIVNGVIASCLACCAMCKCCCLDPARSSKDKFGKGFYGKGKFDGGFGKGGKFGKGGFDKGGFDKGGFDKGGFDKGGKGGKGGKGDVWGAPVHDPFSAGPDEGHGKGGDPFQAAGWQGEAPGGQGEDHGKSSGDEDGGKKEKKKKDKKSKKDKDH